MLFRLRQLFLWQPKHWNKQDSRCAPSER
jgi:hypothetical protein